MKSKDVHQSKPVVYQGRYPNIPSLSMNYETRRQREYFPGHRSQTWSSLSGNNWSPEKTGNLLGKTNISKIPLTDYWVDISNPTKKAETAEKIGWKKKFSSSRGRDSERTLPENLGNASRKILGFENRKGDPQEQSGVLKFFPKGQVF